MGGYAYLNLTFDINNQILQRTDKQIIVNKSRNYIHCTFTFKTEEWNNIEKFAIFKNNRGKAYTCFLGKSIECTCTIPSPAMTGNYMKISIYGGDLITTTELKIILLPSGYTIDISPIDPSAKDVFVEAFETIQSKIDQVEFEDGYLKCYGGGVLLDETPIITNLEETIRELIPSFRLTEDGDLIVNYP